MDKEFKDTIMSMLESSIEAFKNGDTSKERLEEINLYSSIVRNIVDVVRINQTVELESQMMDYVNKLDPKVMEGILGKFGNWGG